MTKLKPNTNHLFYGHYYVYQGIPSSKIHDYTEVSNTDHLIVLPSLGVKENENEKNKKNKNKKPELSYF